MKIITGIIGGFVAWGMSYLSIIAALISGKMMLDDDSDLPPHLRRENQND